MATTLTLATPTLLWHLVELEQPRVTPPCVDLLTVDITHAHGEVGRLVRGRVRARARVRVRVRVRVRGRARVKG